MDPDGTVKLLSAILAGVRPLPGAKCIGRHELYDEVIREDPDTAAWRPGAATRLCLGCPARPQCPTVTTSSTVTLSGMKLARIAGVGSQYRD
ncbi:MAG: hypothetical protein ACRDQU_07110 [Pseudonocardiaceae bacterium]